MEELTNIAMAISIILGAVISLYHYGKYQEIKNSLNFAQKVFAFVQIGMFVSLAWYGFYYLWH